MSDCVPCDSSLIQELTTVLGSFSHQSLESSVRCDVDPARLIETDVSTLAHEATHFYETVGTANGVRLLALRATVMIFGAGMIADAAKSCQGTITIPLMDWLRHHATTAERKAAVAEIDRSMQTYAYLTGSRPRSTQRPADECQSHVFGFRMIPGHQPIEGQHDAHTSVDLPELITQYLGNKWRTHEPLGGKLLREGVAKMVDIFWEVYAHLIRTGEIEKQDGDVVNARIREHFSKRFSEESAVEEMHTYYAAYNLFRVHVPAEYRWYPHFLVLAELALMNDYIVTHSLELKVEQRELGGIASWSRDVSPGVHFLRLVTFLKSGDHGIEPIHQIGRGDSLRFADSLTQATGMLPLAELRQRTVEFVNGSMLLGGGPSAGTVVVQDVAKCLELQGQLQETFFVTLCSPQMFEIVPQLLPPVKFRNTMMRPGEYDRASFDVVSQILFNRSIRCAVEREEDTALCHVLSEKGSCRNVVPDALCFAESSAYHDDCWYFDALRAIQGLGVTDLIVG